MQPPFATRGPSVPRLGLRANLGQFLLLVLINAFVGAMVGLERGVVPLLGRRQFGLTSSGAVLSFIVGFGIVKALANLFAGRLGDHLGRKGVLVAGWLAGLPVPLLIIVAPSWGWIVGANVLLGINQGLCWSTTVIMKIDLVGPRRRGLAMGLNEAAGYGAVSLASIAAGYLATTYGLRPQPFLPGIGFALAGLLLSTFFVRESQGHARREAAALEPAAPADDAPATGAVRPPPATPHAGVPGSETPSFGAIFALTSWKDRSLFSASQAGLVNNLNDGLAWGLFPLYFAAAGLGVAQIGLLAGIYPGVWCVGQLATGAISDRLGRKGLIVGGMWLQAGAILLLPVTRGFAPWALAMVLLGVGTALVYPTLLAAVSDVAHPRWRASAVGVYRLWRDTGYAVGAVLAGALADRFGIPWAIAAIGALTFASGVVALARMEETLPAARAGPATGGGADGAGALSMFVPPASSRGGSSMSRRTGHQYATRTGMVVNPARAYPKIPGADIVFPPFDVSSYGDLNSALAQGLVDPNTKLMVLEVGRQRLALVLKQMAYHHVAQGQLQGQAWAAFFCVSCNMGASLVPIVNGRVLRFRVTGIYNGMSMMSDYETGSVWEHVTGECIRGSLQGSQLETRSAQYLTAAQTLESAPDAKIALSKASWRSRLLGVLLLRRMLAPTGYMPGIFRLSMTRSDTRLPELELGLGIWIDGHARFYPKKTIRKRNNALVDTLNRQQVVVYIDPISGAPAAHRSTSRIHGWDGDALMLESGELIRNGYVLHPTSGKQPIDRPNQQFTRWYGFSYMFPECEVFSTDS